jgi:hypothetical protein
MSELLRLRIPRGWAVLDNKLYDTDPKVEKSTNFIINWHEGFIEDVMWIKECSVNNEGKFEIANNKYFNIDISWLPDSDSTGQYYANLSWHELDNMVEIEKFESKNRFEVRDRIEFWMNDIKGSNSIYHDKVNK